MKTWPSKSYCSLTCIDRSSEWYNPHACADGSPRPRDVIRSHRPLPVPYVPTTTRTRTLRDSDIRRGSRLFVGLLVRLRVDHRSYLQRHGRGVRLFDEYYWVIGERPRNPGQFPSSLRTALTRYDMWGYGDMTYISTWTINILGVNDKYTLEQY
jgi:hypothetical protein